MNARRPTLIEVAAQAGVSKSTASLALRGAAVSKDARDRVAAAATTLGYVYDRAAAAMRGSQSGTIGLIAFDLSNPFFAEFCAGVTERLEEDGALALVADTREDVARQARVLTRMREHRLDGLILCPTKGSSGIDLLEQVSHSLPIVQALRRVDGFVTDYAGAENQTGTAAAVEHLIALGHRRIAFAGETDGNSVQKERFAGVVNTLRSAGLQPPVTIACALSLQGGVSAADAALAHEDRPTALVCFNDIVAIGSTIALSRRGLRPGHDLSITGFDDIAESSLRSPALTTIAVKPRLIGRRTAEMILKRAKQPDAAIETWLQSARLEIRETTGAPRV